MKPQEEVRAACPQAHYAQVSLCKISFAGESLGTGRANPELDLWSELLSPVCSESNRSFFFFFPSFSLFLKKRTLLSKFSFDASVKPFSPTAVSERDIALLSSVALCSRRGMLCLCPQVEVDGCSAGPVDQAVLSLRLGQ